MRLRWQIVLPACWLMMVCRPTPAQQQDATSIPYVLHVYANLVQVPTLALDMHFQPLPPLERKQFSIRLDSGPAFHPTKMHMEGDEPVSLAILLDASGDQDRLVQSFSATLAQLARTSLNRRDSVSMYAVDCELVGSTTVRGADPAALQSSVERMLSVAALHNGQHHGTCGKTLHLWDATAQVVHLLAEMPGRQVLLLVSSGHDHKSNYTFSALEHYAANRSVAIFGMRDLVHYIGDNGAGMVPSGPDVIHYALSSTPEDDFNELCESTGGLTMTLYQNDLAHGLETFLALLRGRYILEFPRPDANEPGTHRIDVEVPSEPSFIATAGVSVPLADESIAADPTTVRSSPSPAVLGKRHPIQPQP